MSKKEVAIALAVVVVLGTIDLISTPEATPEQVSARLWFLGVLTATSVFLLASVALSNYYKPKK